MTPRPALRIAVLAFAVLGGSTLATAHSEFTIPSREEAARVNENTVGVVFTHEELYHQMVHNLEDELEPQSGLRIVPIMGKNHVQSVYDLLYLHGIDLALVRADALEYVRREGGMSALGRITRNVAKLSEEKIVVLASEDYDSLDDLEGQVVGFGLPGSGEYVTGTIALDTLGVEVTPLEVGSTLGIERVRSGELAAMVYLLRPADAVQTGDDLTASEAIAALDGTDGLHVLALPEDETMSTIYRRTTLTARELPGLIDPDESLPTYSVDVILAAYNFRTGHPRQQRQRRFIDALVGGLDGLQGDAHEPAWTRVDLSVETPGVATSPLVVEALARGADRQRAGSGPAPAEPVPAEEEGEGAEDRTGRLAELARRRDELTAQPGRELSEADEAELDRLLERIDTLLGPDAVSADAGGAAPSGDEAPAR